MVNAPAKVLHRILVIDDNPAIHDDIRKILRARETSSPALNDAKAILFGDEPEQMQQDDFEIDSAYQGEEGLHKVHAASEAGRPYALAFVDVRMPPGWDGVETITRIWKDHPDLQIVICTAYSDYSWEDVVRQIGRSSNMVVLKKPFDIIEVLQLAHALTEKWDLNRQVRDQLNNLDRLVGRRTAELEEANGRLKREMAERLQVEKALVVSEERFSKAFNANPIPLAIQSLRRGTITDANKGFRDLAGYSLDEIAGRTPAELDLWVETEQSRDVSAKLQAGASVRSLPCRLRTQSGAVREVLFSIETIELKDETCLLMIVQDITEQLLLEKQLRHSQKMEAVGQLAAGIAHDFNNMLTVIGGNISMIIEDLPRESPLLPQCEDVRAAAQHSATLVGQLLTFSRKQVVEIARISVGELLAPLSQMLPRVLGERIAVRVDVPAGLPPVAVDAGMIEQMLMNLAVNSRDAMPQGGELVITAEAVDATPEMFRSHRDAHVSRFLCLSVRDTGCGIPPAVLPRLFEPFFTTKPVGKGTGLGLATVYGIAKQHGGWIEVSSEVGKGSVFRAFIPFCAGPAVQAPARLKEQRSGARGPETILVVEDEDAVRNCVKNMLKSSGYTVITACTGVECLGIWSARKHEIDLLLTDIVMPEGLTGLELARRLLADAPGLKVVYTSGYSSEVAKDGSPTLNGQSFLAKPYEVGELLRVVRESLDRPRSAPVLEVAAVG